MNATKNNKHMHGKAEWIQHGHKAKAVAIARTDCKRILEEAALDTQVASDLQLYSVCCAACDTMKQYVTDRHHEIIKNIDTFKSHRLLSTLPLGLPEHLHPP